MILCLFIFSFHLIATKNMLESAIHFYINVYIIYICTFWQFLFQHLFVPKFWRNVCCFYKHRDVNGFSTTKFVSVVCISLRLFSAPETFQFNQVSKHFGFCMKCIHPTEDTHKHRKLGNRAQSKKNNLCLKVQDFLKINMWQKKRWESSTAANCRPTERMCECVCLCI